MKFKISNLFDVIALKKEVEKLKTMVKDESNSVSEWIERYENLEKETKFNDDGDCVYIKYNIHGVYREIMYKFTSIKIDNDFIVIDNDEIKRHLSINKNHVVSFDILYKRDRNEE